MLVAALSAAGVSGEWVVYALFAESVREAFEGVGRE